MCEPTTIMMGISAAAALYGGMAANAQAKGQARVAQRQADVERLTAQMRSDEIARRLEQVNASAIAQAGSSGADAGSGSFGDVLASNAAAAGRDQYNTLFLGDQNAQSLEASAANLKASGQNAMIGSVLNFAASAAQTGFTSGAKPPAGMYQGGTGTNPMTGLRYGGV